MNASHNNYPLFRAEKKDDLESIDDLNAEPMMCRSKMDELIVKQGPLLFLDPPDRQFRHWLQLS